MTTPLVEDPRIGRFPFVVEPFSEDCAGRLSWRFLGNHLLRCASLHAGAHGFGFDDMIGKRLVWVLSRLVVEMPNMPTTGQHYDIHTWVARIYRQFTDRHFAITAPDGTPYGHAFSTWALINLDSREPVDLTDSRMAGLSDVCTERPLPIAPPGRL
ncbi:MAG: thioesterase, partial [Alloprevotella sp.]|nr:thioesterase [Alloprevotella sp.]